MSNKLTVIIPCKDEQRNIRDCIASIREIADEILIADSGSTDGTLEIVQEIGDCRIIEREYIHSGDFKNWAIPQARHPWVLIMDADERVTEEMAAEIRGILQDPQHDGYWIYRNNHFLGHPIRYSGWQRDKVLRLFRRDLGRYQGDTDHAEVSVSTERVGRLKTRLTHYSYWSYDQYFAKFHRYTTYQAQVWHQQNRRPTIASLLFRGPLRFLKAYILELGFLDGYAGIQVCLLHGFYSFVKQARLWELNDGLPQPDPEAERAASADQQQKSAA